MHKSFAYFRHRHDRLIAVMALLALLAVASNAARAATPAADPSTDTAVFAGGCFWGVEAVFEHVRGVRDVRSGYAGGNADGATYERVSSGDTGHAEVVEVVFDPKVVSYGTLLSVFFSVAHDPTQLNRQGPDTGTQYRSAIFYRSEAQKRAAQEYITQLGIAAKLMRPVVTQVVPLRRFHPAEHYHQDFMRLNPMHPYIVIHD
ncbi:MAG: peptide-methionine (S)-S-oxide reductase MsrA, partial [Arenimonas sp.]